MDSVTWGLLFVACLFALLFCLPGGAILQLSLRWIKREKHRYGRCAFHVALSTFLASVFCLAGIGIDMVAGASKNEMIQLLSLLFSSIVSGILLSRFTLREHPPHPVFYTVFGLLMAAFGTFFVMFAIPLIAGPPIK